MSKQDEWRALADVLDRAADNDRNPTRVPLLHEAAAALRDAADRLDAVDERDAEGFLEAANADLRDANARLDAAQAVVERMPFTAARQALRAALTTPTDQEASK